MRIPYPVMRILGSMAEAEATALGVPMTIALVDEEGTLRFFGRMDGALPASAEIAVSKAYTAAALRMPTHEVGELAQPGRMLYGIQHTHNGRIILFGGGFPLRIRGAVAGGIGISGGTVDEDMRVAGPVLEALGSMEEWAEALRTRIAPQGLGAGRMPRVEAVLRQVLGRALPDVSRDDLDVVTGALYLMGAEGA